MKQLLALCVLCLLGAVAYVLTRPKPIEPPPPVATYQPPSPRVEAARAWKLSQDDKVHLVGGGALSVIEGGVVDATYLRTDGTNLVLKLIDGGTGWIALESLSAEDLSYVESLIDVAIDEPGTERSVLEQKLTMARKLGDHAAVAMYQKQLELAAHQRWESEQAGRRAHQKAIDAARASAELRRLQRGIELQARRRKVTP